MITICKREVEIEKFVAIGDNFRLNILKWNALMPYNFLSFTTIDSKSSIDSHFSKGERLKFD